ncbi:unnamed protein product [Merluccius merluccius]
MATVPHGDLSFFAVAMTEITASKPPLLSVFSFLEEFPADLAGGKPPGLTRSRLREEEEEEWPPDGTASLFHKPPIGPTLP